MPQERPASRSEATTKNPYAAPMEETRAIEVAAKKDRSMWKFTAFQASTGFCGGYAGLHAVIAEMAEDSEAFRAFEEIMVKIRDMTERALDISHGTSSERMVENILGGVVGALVGIGMQVGLEMSGRIIGKTIVAARKTIDHYSEKQVAE